MCYLDLLRNGSSHSFPGTPGTEGGGESAVSGRSAWETSAADDVGGRPSEVQITALAAPGGVKAPPAVNRVTLGRHLHLSYWSFQRHSHLLASLECGGLGPTPDENLHFQQVMLVRRPHLQCHCSKPGGLYTPASDSGGK